MGTLIWLNMHLKNLSKREINKYVFSLFSILIFYNCHPDNGKVKLDVKSFQRESVIYRDSLMYHFSIEAENKLDNLIENDSISIISLLSNSDENRFNLTFSFFENKLYAGNKAKFIIKHCNRYLKTKKHLFKIFLIEDKFFCVSPKDSIYYTFDLPGGGITVNAKGELLSFYSERYRLSKTKAL